MSSNNSNYCPLNFSSIIKSYKTLQSKLSSKIKKLASNMSTANPGAFILLQFQMAQVSQVGDSISNLIAKVNSVIQNAVSQMSK